MVGWGWGGGGGGGWGGGGGHLKLLTTQDRTSLAIFSNFQSLMEP